MPDYDSIDPASYLARFGRIPRERYLREHWYTMTTDAIHRYCRGERVVDLGSGFGDYTREIEARCLRVGIDLSSRWLAYAQKSHGICAVRADAQNIPLRDRACDAALSIGLLEYTDPEAVIHEIARVLQPGKFCVLVCANKYSAYRLTLRLLLALRGRRHEAREVSLSALRRSMRRHGVDPIEVVMDDALIWLPDWIDRRLGIHIYRMLETLARPFGHNPLSNAMLVVGQRRM
jgi:SAM-dependent methyltransferase